MPLRDTFVSISGGIKPYNAIDRLSPALNKLGPISVILKPISVILSAAKDLRVRSAINKILRCAQDDGDEKASIRYTDKKPTNINGKPQ